jgi:hypothetical protein
MIARFSRWPVGVVLLGLLLGTAGCATTSFCTTCCCWPVQLPPTGEVTQIMALWADGVVIQPNPDPRYHGHPTPGFNGRVYLYGPQHKEPLAADGVLTVYLYDTTHDADNKIPLEVWNVDEANLARVGKRDSLGWGYNLWLPWTTFSKDVHRVNLVVKYHPHEGLDRFSGHTKLTVNDDSGLRPPAQLDVTGSRLTPQGQPLSAEPGSSVRASTIAVPRSSSLSRLAPEPPAPGK